MFNNIKVREWMSTPVISVTPTTPLSSAHHLMQTSGIRRLPVIKNNRLVGIITLGDVREAQPSNASTLSIWEMSELLDKLTVEEVMTKNVLSIGQDDPIIAAAQLMLNRKISGLPVLDSAGTLVGMLTESDIFRMVIRFSLEPASS